MENYNQEIRNIFGKHIDASIECGLSIRESASSYANTLYKLETTSNPYKKLYREYLIFIMYLDAYKLALYRQKQCIADDSDTEFLGQLTDVKNKEDLLILVSVDKDFLIRLIEECYRFREMYGLFKVNIIKSLSDSVNEWLLEKFPIHQQDLDIYNIDVKLEHILRSIESQSRHQEKDCFYKFQDAIVLNIMGFIQNLTNFDYDNAEKLLLEIAGKDYAASKFLESCSDESEVFLDHIDLYENYSKRDILYELMSIPEFLCDAIWNIACVYVYHEYDGIKIDTKELDDCRDTEVMKKLGAK